MRTNQRTLPPRETAWGFFGTWSSNRASDPHGYSQTPERAWQLISRKLNEEWDFGPEAIRRILDSAAGRHLADQALGDQPVHEVFRHWMNGRHFKSRILSIVQTSDVEFYEGGIAA